MPKRSIASGFAMPPSTTALAAATLVSKSYVACDSPMASSPPLPLPAARYVYCHFFTVLTGTSRLLATDLCPRPSANMSAASSLSLRSCLHRRPTDMRKPPISRTFISMSKKWEAVHNPHGRPLPPANHTVAEACSLHPAECGAEQPARRPKQDSHSPPPRAPRRRVPRRPSSRASPPWQRTAPPGARTGSPARGARRL